MAASHDPLTPRRGSTRRTALGLIVGTPLVAACSSIQSSLTSLSPNGEPSGPPQQPTAVGTGQVKVGLILPLSARATPAWPPRR